MLIAEEKIAKFAILAIFAASTFFILGVAVGLLVGDRDKDSSSELTEFRNPDGPPTIKGPTFPPPQP